jgi:hypothetical protein
MLRIQRILIERCCMRWIEERTRLARLMKSSQSRVAKMVAGDPSVSLDLLVEGLLTAGASRREIASALASSKAANE